MNARKLKKMRGDSTFAKLSVEELAEVDELLLCGTGYAEVQAWLAERGLTCSQTSVADYYQTHVVPQKWARANRRVKQVGELAADGVDEVTLNELRTLVLDMTLTPGADLKSIKTLYTLVLKGRQIDLDSRRIAVLEKKAAQLDAAREALEKRKAEGGLSPEALAEIEGMLNLM